MFPEKPHEQRVEGFSMWGRKAVTRPVNRHQSRAGNPPGR